MAVNTMPKAYKYFIVYGDGELELTTDPKGWQEHSIGFTRSEDFGLNVEVVVPLSFSGAGRLKLKQLYEATGVFTKANIRIEKRNPITWVLETFYTYRLDFKTYKDNLRYVEISGIEDGLLSKFQTYKDTEYEIPLPVIGKKFVNYTGVTVDKKNILQCLYGSIQDREKQTISEDAYLLMGNRSVRAYNDNISFVDNEGLPFETMTFRCIKSTSFTAKISFKLTVVANGTLFDPSAGTLKIVKHNASFASPTILASYSPTTSSVSASKRTDIFTTDTTQAFTLFAGDYISVFYYAQSPKTYDDITVKDAYNGFIEMSNEVQSVYQNSELEVVTYEWLIEQLLAKIADPVVPTFNCGITYPNFRPLISATPCIKNLGKTYGSGILKVKLSDVLKSFNILEKIGIDIDGNTFTINSRNAFYSNVNAGLITANNIVVSHDEKHQYGKITVGYDVDKMSEDGDLVYPFNCKKEFEIVDTTIENEIDLVNPFKADPYDIDKYVYDTLSSETNQDNCEFIILATTGLYGTVEHNSILQDDFQSQRYGSESELYFYDEDLITNESPALVIQTTLGDEPSLGNPFFKYNFNNYNSSIYRVRLSINCNTVGEVIGEGFGISSLAPYIVHSYKSVILKTNNTYSVDYDFLLKSNLDEGGDYSFFMFTFNFDTVNVVNFTNFLFNVEYIYSDISWSDIVPEYKLYKRHTITDFNGAAATAYNVPITPKRILQKHLDYLSLSNYGNENDIKFVKSDFVSAITSECDFETANVVENADLASITPMFLPCTIECDTVQYYNSDFSDNKYKYIQVKDEKTGKIYEGWINSITFAPTRNKSQKLILQAKTI